MVIGAGRSAYIMCHETCGQRESLVGCAHTRTANFAHEAQQILGTMLAVLQSPNLSVGVALDVPLIGPSDDAIKLVSEFGTDRHEWLRCFANVSH
jgi:hypothetical protein